MSAVLDHPMFQQPGDLPPVDRRLSWPAKAGIALAAAAMIALAVWGSRHMLADAKAPARQVARIAILPDTPPPPPPPKIERKEEAPKAEQRPQPQPDNVPKPDVPQDAPIKMDGPAGDGPSAFSSGPITKDYQGGTPVIGATAATPAVDRARERIYVSTVRQQLRDEIERQLGSDTTELTTGLALWIGADGRITRWELSEATAGHENELQAAMTRCASLLRLPAPPGITLPMRFRLTLRAAG